MALTLAECKKIIQRYTKEDSIPIDYKIVPISDSPVGFLGEHFKLCIKYKTENNRLKMADFFLKCVPTGGNQDFTDYVIDMGIFRKEATIYRDLLVDFQTYHPNLIAAKSYLVNPQSFLVLEDVSKKGYAMANALSHEDMLELMKTLARFHASSIIFEERRSFSEKPYRLIDHFREDLKETTFSEIEGTPRYKWGLTTSKAVADTMLMKSEKYQEIADDFLQFARVGIFDYVHPSAKFRNVICHADLWKNNALFKDNKALDADERGCVLIDFQLVRYAPPVLDVLTALHVNSSTKYLQENKHELLDVYFNTFRSSLERNGVSIDVVFKDNELQESLDYYEIASLTEAVMFGTIIFVGDELAQKLSSDVTVFNEFIYTDRSKYVREEICTNAHFREKYSDVLERLIDCLLRRRNALCD